MRQSNYELVFTPSLFTNTVLKVELIDNFLNTRTLLSVIDSVAVPFTITSDPASSATDRFKIVFGQFGPLAIDMITISAQQKNSGVQVNWTAKTEKDMDRYELERSFNGTVFTRINTTAAIGNSPTAVNYSWLDVSPQPGNNFYRIKAIDRSGMIKYTDVVKVGFGKPVSSVTVTPNPVVGNVLTLKLNDVAKGNYSIVLYNNAGQQVYNTAVNHNGGSAVIPVSLNKSISQGIYRLVITGTDFNITEQIIKN